MTICTNCDYHDTEDHDRCPSCNFLHAPALPAETTAEVIADVKVSEAEQALVQAKEEAAAVAEVHAPPVAIVEHPAETPPVAGEAVTTGAAAPAATFPAAPVAA